MTRTLSNLGWLLVLVDLVAAAVLMLLVRLEGGVPRDHGSPPGSVMARVMANGQGRTTDVERGDSAYAAFRAAV